MGQTDGVRIRLVPAIAVALTLTACGQGDGRSTASFCSRLQASVELLEGPLSTPAELAALVTRYRELQRVAPLSIEASWTAVTELMESAASVDRTDADAVDSLARQAYATDLAAREVATWVQERCGFVLPRTSATG